MLGLHLGLEAQLVDVALEEGAQQLRVPPALLPYQQRWIADTAEVKIIEKSRRVGISWAEAADAVLYAAAESGDDVWYIGYNREMAMEFILDAGMWARKFQSFIATVEETEEVFTDSRVVDGQTIVDEQKILAFRITAAIGLTISLIFFFWLPVICFIAMIVLFAFALLKTAGHF